MPDFFRGRLGRESRARRVRTLFFLGVGVTCVLTNAIVFVACSSSDSNDVAGPDAATSPDGPISNIESGTPTDATKPPIADAAADVVDQDVCASRPACDCDTDGYLRADCVDATAPDADSIIDCDDHNPLVHPGAPFSVAPGDTDCSGQVETAFAPNLKCMLIAVNNCQPGTGFLDQPDCGVTDNVYQCQLVALNNCQPVLKGPQTQLCK